MLKSNQVNLWRRLFNRGQHIIDYLLLSINDEIYCHFKIRNPGILESMAPQIFQISVQKYYY